jgi:hypothetical protein
MSALSDSYVARVLFARHRPARALDVIENGVVAGRIFFLDAVGPQGRPWMWASGHNGDIRRAAHGYQPTREAAMALYRAGVGYVSCMTATHSEPPAGSRSRVLFIARRMGLGPKPAPGAAELRLSGPMVGEQKLGEGARELPLGAARMKKTGWPRKPDSSRN